LRYYAGDMASIFAYFRERWLLPRAERNACWRQVRREHLRLSSQLQHYHTDAGCA